MRNILILLVLSTILLTACESEGRLRINNFTDNKVYFTFNNKSYILADSTYRIVTKKINKSWNPFANNEKTSILTLFGETFIYEKEGIEYEDIEVTLKPDKTLNLYCTANRACVEIQNLTDSPITDFHYQRFIDDEFDEESENFFADTALEPNEYMFYRLKLSDDTGDTRKFSYVFSAADSLGNTTISSRILMDEDKKFYFIVE